MSPLPPSTSRSPSRHQKRVALLFIRQIIPLISSVTPEADFTWRRIALPEGVLLNVGSQTVVGAALDQVR